MGYADNPLVFKSIALVSTANATNLAGTIYETGYTSTVTGTAGTLAPIAGIVAELLASAAATSVAPDAPTEPVA